MTWYVVQRVLGTIPTMLIVGVIAFFLVQLSPGDPSSFFLGPDAPPGAAEEIRQRLGLNQPILVQFVQWLRTVLQGDLGRSLHRGDPVLDLFLRALPASLYLTLSAFTLAVLLGVSVGVLSAIRQGSWFDSLTTLFVFTGLAVPNFWLGMLLVMVFGIHLGWLPVQGFVSPFDDLGEAARRLVLPTIALGYAAAALIARMTRSSMLGVLRQDFVRTARSKGLSERIVVLKHALRNVLNDVLTVSGLVLVSLLSGNIVIELVFNYPGLGRLVVEAVFRRDYPLIQGSLILVSMITILMNLVIDVLYSVVDPRIEYA